MKTKLDFMVIAVGLVAVAALGAGWLVRYVRVHGAASGTSTRLVAGHASMSLAPALTSTNGKPPDIKILHAVWGLRGRTADVTARVAELMRTRGGVHADSQDVGVDPWPHKKKWMTIEYTAQGKYAVLKLHAGRVAGRVQLMNNAGMDVSGTPLSPAAVASTNIVVDDDGDAPSIAVQTVTTAPAGNLR